MRMRRHDVPKQHVVVEAELCEDAMDDRRRRLRRAAAAELALRREGQPAHARAAIAGRLADEQIRRAAPPPQVRDQPLPAEPRRRVLVERLADSRTGERLDEIPLVQAASLPRR